MPPRSPIRRNAPSLILPVSLDLSLPPGRAASQQAPLADGILGAWTLVAVAGERAAATPEEAIAVVWAAIAYYGTYSVNAADRTLSLGIEGSTFANLAGDGPQVRTITSLTEDELSFTNPRTPSGTTLHTVWRRARLPSRPQAGRAGRTGHGRSAVRLWAFVATGVGRRTSDRGVAVVAQRAGPTRRTVSPAAPRRPRAA